MEALRIVVAGGRQELRVPFGLDALGHQLQAQRMRHLRGGLDDDAIVGVVAHAHDERLVELERVHRQVAQVAERRIAGAEIVDGDEHAELVDFLDHAQRARRVEHHRALGDLELERGGEHAGSFEQLAQVRRESGVLQQARGEIHGDAHVHAAIAPGADLRQRAAQRPFGERADQVGGLGDGDESSGLIAPCAG